ncbi:MAG: rod shape-determining protein MreC [Rickettsia endosymbiont of Bryobia graminum]|nr:rod shape-determining protein MreC [Rickettsia endosymbiont of Bryobia graminum]
MALLENRVRTNSEISIFFRFILTTFRRIMIILLLILSLYVYTSSPKKLSSISLEIFGSYISSLLSIHETIFHKINVLTQNFIYIQDLARENIKLRLEITKLKQLENNLYLLQTENKELRGLLTLVEEQQYKYITAKLISVALNPFSKTAIISVGTKQGIEVNQIVTHGQDLVGRIIEVSNNYSKVMLINDVNSRIPIITSLSKEKGIITGDGNNCKILYLPETNLIQKDETVSTSGHGNIYPSGITVGHVSNINYNNVTVKPLVDLSTVEFVNILMPATN